MYLMIVRDMSDETSTVRFNIIKRFDTELKWIKLLQSASPLGFTDNIYHERNISKCVFYFRISKK